MQDRSDGLLVRHATAWGFARLSGEPSSMSRLSNAATTMLLGSVLALPALAAPNPISVHVLDQQTGLPAQGMQVELESVQGDGWARISQGRTNADGRIATLYPAGQALQPGRYRITFQTGDWYTARAASTFYPKVEVVIDADGSLPHYHVPLLLSPYGYSTYRGS